MIMKDKRQTYYYVTAQSSELGKELMHLIRRYDEAMQAADKLAQNMRADEWCPDPRYIAGGIWRFIFKNPPKAKKSLIVVAQDKDGNYECAPNPEYNCGLRLAKKVAALPHVTDEEVCEAFGFDLNDPIYTNQLVPQFFAVDDVWVYIRSSFDLSALRPDLTRCMENIFEEALQFIEQESPTLLSEE